MISNFHCFILFLKFDPYFIQFQTFIEDIFCLMCKFFSNNVEEKSIDCTPQIKKKTIKLIMK